MIISGGHLKHGRRTLIKTGLDLSLFFNSNYDTPQILLPLEMAATVRKVRFRKMSFEKELRINYNLVVIYI